MRVMIGTDDVTRMFDDDTTTQVLDDPETAGSDGGLGIYYVERRMTYLSATPEISWNNKMLTCIAEKNGFPDDSASAVVIARCTSKPYALFTQTTLKTSGQRILTKGRIAL